MRVWFVHGYSTTTQSEHSARASVVCARVQYDNTVRALSRIGSSKSRMDGSGRRLRASVWLEGEGGRVDKRDQRRGREERGRQRGRDGERQAVSTARVVYAPSLLSLQSKAPPHPPLHLSPCYARDAPTRLVFASSRPRRRRPVLASPRQT